MEYEQVNDIYKKDLAIANGISHYIELDCRYSEHEYIKKSILNSNLNNIFDLSNVDWDKCYLNTTTSILIDIKNMWNNGIKSSEKIAKKLNVHESTVIKYLKRANDLGLCEYSPHCYREGKKVLCVETGKIYHSIGSVKNDGYCSTFISKCCHGEYEIAYGLHWQFI